MENKILSERVNLTGELEQFRRDAWRDQLVGSLPELDGLPSNHLLYPNFAQDPQYCGAERTNKFKSNQPSILNHIQNCQFML